MTHVLPIMETFGQNYPPSPEVAKPKQSQPFWVQLPDICPTKVLFAKGKLPDAIILPPIVIGSSPNTKTKSR
jgi:hypothetical protein